MTKEVLDSKEIVKEYIFPYHLFPEGSRVVIYGAWEVGKAMYLQAMTDGYVKIEGIVDPRGTDACSEDEEIPVESVESILHMQYDYVMIAIGNKDNAEKVKKKLMSMGISEREIKWDSVYVRKDFYKMYFKMLRCSDKVCKNYADLVKCYTKAMWASVYDHAFPYHLFTQGAKVVIYGAGDIGRKFYTQAIRDKYVEAVGIVDKNAAALQDLGLPIYSVSRLNRLSYDYVLISIHDQKIAETVAKNLMELGVQEEKIKWDGKSYAREEFQQNIYLNMLRGMNDAYPSYLDMISDLKNRLELSVEYIFPWHLFHKDERIAIYGGNRIGQDFYRQARRFDYVDVALIVDEEERPYIPDVPLRSVSELQKAEVDAILIAETDEKKANAIKEKLQIMGIQDEAIRWDGRHYRRQDFIGDYYLKKLQGC